LGKACTIKDKFKEELLPIFQSLQIKEWKFIV